MKCLALAQADVAQGRLPSDKQAELLANIAELIEDLSEDIDTTPDPEDNLPQKLVPAM